MLLRDGWKRWFGLRGEDFAARYLKQQGYRILARRARVLGGDIDLIARHENTLIFVEVKTRVSSVRGTPLEAVDLAKQRQLTRLANAWLHKYKLQRSKYQLRFDVIGLTWPAGQWSPQVQHVMNAFPATDGK